MIDLIDDNVVPVQGHLPAVLQVIVLQLGPHEPGAGLHHLLDGVRLGGDHGGAVVQPEGALVVTTHHQPNPLVAAQVHVEVVCVRPLEVGQHGYVLLYDLVLLGFISQ